MLDLIRRFLFFNPNQRLTADAALAHAFFHEREEPSHTTTAHLEPITPPDKCQPDLPSHHDATKPITPMDLLSTPRTPYQICPDWETDRPVSRYGRLCSAIKDERLSSHVDRFLHDSEDPTWLNQSRPIYSSHQKVHPVTDRPNSSNLWNKYNYAAHQRPSTPVVEHSTAVSHGHGHHNPGPTASVSSKRYSIDEFIGDTHRRIPPHHLHHHPDHSHHPNQIMTRPPTAAYGTQQMIKWAPPHFTQRPPLPPAAAVPVTHHHVPAPAPHHHVPHQHYRQPAVVQDPELSRPESRRCRSPAPFSSQLMKHKHTTTVHTNSTSLNPTSPIQCWTAPSVTTSVNTDKVFMAHDGGGDFLPYVRKSDKPQSTHRNSTSHRFNLWVPEDDAEENAAATEENTMDHDRSVFLPLQ